MPRAHASASKPRLWIFDLDGTLTDSFPIFFSILGDIFSRHGKTPDPARLREALGTPMPGFFARNLGSDRANAALGLLREQSIARAGEIRAYPGIFDCLAALEESGASLALWTARDLASTERVVEASGLARFFPHRVTGCCVSRSKPDPAGAYRLLAQFRIDASHAVMIGDHDHDLLAARAASLFGVRASWGGYWPNKPCSLAHRQFFSVTDFADWTQES